MIKYSIISVVNKQYKKFASVFIQSALENLNLDNIHEICILDTGLSQNDHDNLSALHPKVKLIKFDNEISSDVAWDSGWQDNVLLKTKFTYDYINKNKIPACMIDIDSMFIKDLSDIMKHEGDVILCDRSEEWSGMPYIASFVGFLNVDKSLQFISQWRTAMDNITTYETKETPALNEMARNNSEYDLIGASFKIVGLYHDSLINDETRILHFKGGGMSENISVDEAVMIRFNRFPSHITNIMKYLQHV